jgi:hypothetical protein
MFSNTQEQLKGMPQQLTVIDGQLRKEQEICSQIDSLHEKIQQDQKLTPVNRVSLAQNPVITFPDESIFVRGFRPN